jgi:hypothetical protein
MAKKSNINAVTQSIVTVLRNNKAIAAKIPLTQAQKGKDTVARTVLENYFRAEAPKITAPLVAISTKTNKILTLQEVEDIERQLVNTTKNSVEEYILVSKEKALKYIENLNASDDVKKQLKSEANNNSRAWDAFSATLTRVHGGKSTVSPYIKEINKYKEEAIIKIPNLISKNKFLELIKAHYKVYNSKIAENLRFAVTPSGRFIIITDDQEVKTCYKIKVKGKYDDLTNVEFWEEVSIEGPYLDINDSATGTPKDIAHFRFADQTIKSMGLITYLEEAETLLDKNTEEDLLKTITELKVIAQQKVQDAKGASIIIGGKFEPGRTGRTSSDPAILAARKAGVIIKGNDILLPVVYEDTKTFNIATNSIVLNSVADLAFNIISDDNGVLYTAANRTFNQSLQRAMELSSYKELIAAMTKKLLDPGSLSIIATLLGNSLSKVFNDKKLQSYVNTNKSKKYKKTESFLRIGKKGKRINTKIPKPKKYSKSILAKAIPNFKKTITKGISYLGEISFSEDSTNTLLSLINANLRQEVVAQMKYPALVNRTGRFAGSVRAIDIINSQISVTFMKSPYTVFMQQGGKPPWNTKDRDPIKIINKAISSISSKYRLNISKVNIK